MSSLSNNLQTKKLINEIIENEKVRNIYIQISNAINNENLLNNITKYDDKSLNTKEENALNFFKNSISQFLKYGNDFDFDDNYENPLNLKTGITGEAYIYELLCNSNEYKNVKWNMINEENGEDFEYNGKIYKIKPDGAHYDILVETKDGQELYIEVKSTKYEFGNKVPFYLSQKQIEKMNNVKSPNEYVIAIVFDALTKPKHFFMTLRKNFYK